MDGPVPGYVPRVRGGGMMHVRMLCLGKHWNGLVYKYEPSRSDFDGLTVPPLPDDFRRLANGIAESVGLRDDITPPSTVFAAYNHYAGPKEIRVLPYSGHDAGSQCMYCAMAAGVHTKSHVWSAPQLAGAGPPFEYRSARSTG